MLKAKRLEEANLVLNKLKEDAEKYHVGSVNDGLLDQMSALPMA